MDPIQRRDTIVTKLRRSGLISIDKLADFVGASRRTILRDIQVLREQGFVIDSDRGPGGGLLLDPGSIQTTAKLSVVEMFSLLISVEIVKEAYSIPFSETAERGLRKLEKALTRDKARELRDVLERVYISSATKNMSGTTGSVHRELLEIFEACFLQRHMMRFSYADRLGRETVRIIEPQALLIKAPIWYLVGFDPEKDDFRHFRMDRIANPVSLKDMQFRLRRVQLEDTSCPFIRETTK